MSKLFLIGMLLASFIIIGARFDKEKPKYIMPERNVEFFLDNNTEFGILDTISTLAQLLCIEDNKLNNTIEEHNRVAKICLDSKATEEEYYIVSDGKWHQYAIPALNMITEMCKTRLNEVCKGFK